MFTWCRTARTASDTAAMPSAETASHQNTMLVQRGHMMVVQQSNGPAAAAPRAAGSAVLTAAAAGGHVTGAATRASGLLMALTLASFLVAVSSRMRSHPTNKKSS